MGVATSGIGLGGVVITPIASVLITSYGWRIAYVVLGIGVMVVMLPLLLLVRNSPEDMGLLPDGEKSEEIKSPSLEPSWTIGAALRSPVFWLASLGLFLVYGTVFGTMSHEVPFLRDMVLSLSVIVVKRPENYLTY